ncbi:hypothetical protein ACFW2V_13740 [Streptomyces sp. NPDC058947]|uniref:hypothetical protein n=1 Tax=Streptomyces sp. NPDC058947 TaxID=3346675 RepID=UPI0036C6DD38
MSNGMDMKDWGETTIRTPGSWANVADMHRVISELFCHDSVHAYQQRTTEAGLREAVADMRRAMDKRLEDRGEAGDLARVLIEEILSHFDPDHEEYGGYLPSTLVCPLHGQPEKERSNDYGRMLPVLSKCPGVPRCRAHEGVRVE